MEAFWKTAAVVLLTVILGTALGKTEKDIAVVLTAVCCCIAAIIAMQYLSEVVGLLWKLGNYFESSNFFIGTLLRITGVAILTELTHLISADAGSSSLGKVVQILGNSVILYLSVPVIESFLSMIQEILGVL